MKGIYSNTLTLLTLIVTLNVNKTLATAMTSGHLLKSTVIVLSGSEMFTISGPVLEGVSPSPHSDDPMWLAAYWRASSGSMKSLSDLLCVTRSLAGYKSQNFTPGLSRSIFLAGVKAARYLATSRGRSLTICIHWTRYVRSLMDIAFCIISS